MGTIGFVGGGNMAEALIKGVITANLYASENVFVSDIRTDRLEFLTNRYGVTACKTNSEVAAKVDTLVLSVKPQTMNEALDSIKDAVGGETLIISIVAGIKAAKIAGVLGNVPIVRVMPNTPALIGEGASALFANERAKDLLERAMSIFSAVGKAVIVCTHRLDEAERLCDRFGLLHHGRLLHEGTLAQLQQRSGCTTLTEMFLQFIETETDGKVGTP